MDFVESPSPLMLVLKAGIRLLLGADVPTGRAEQCLSPVTATWRALAAVGCVRDTVSLLCGRDSSRAGAEVSVCTWCILGLC